MSENLDEDSGEDNIENLDTETGGDYSEGPGANVLRKARHRRENEDDEPDDNPTKQNRGGQLGWLRARCYKRIIVMPLKRCQLSRQTS